VLRHFLRGKVATIPVPLHPCRVQPRTSWRTLERRACGLRPLRDDEPVDLYEIIRTRYERSATLITSNRSAPEMGELFGDPLLASAAMDRLLHDAHVLILEGASFRNPGDRRKSKKNNQQEAST
jgi:hypothetical protein